MSLKSTSRDCSTPNPPGVKAVVYFTESKNVDTFPPIKTTTEAGDSVTLDGNITLKAGKEWAALEFQTKNGKLRGARTGERGAGGGFDNFFEGYYPGMTPVEMETVALLNGNCGYVCIVQQKNGENRVIGNPDEPAFPETLEYDTGLTGSDKSGTTVTIGAELDIPAPFYEGTITPINEIV